MLKNEATLMHALDRLIAFWGLVILSPLLVIIALAIKVWDRGPLFYRAQRVGKDGVPFWLLKFRTMVVGADRQGPGVTIRGDKRITPIGRFLRRTKLDELPQFINVLRGEMSLVGPRPEDPRYVAHYTPEERSILAVRPGVTSAATICYRDEEQLLQGPDWEAIYINQVMREKLAIDRAYLARRTLFGDLNILLHTLLAIFHFEPSVRREEAPHTLETLLRQAEAPSRLGRFVATRWPLALVDGAVVLASLWLALLLRFDGVVPPAELHALLVASPFALLVYLLCIRQAGLYRFLWRYAGSREIWRIVGATAAATVLLVTGLLAFAGPVGRVPLSVPLLGGLLATLGLVSVRYRQRLLTGAMGYIQPIVGSPQRRRVLVVGAGEAGSRLGQALGQRLAEYELVGYIDDDPRKHGRWLGSAQVLGGRGEIERVVTARGVGLIILALRHVAEADLADVLARCRCTRAELRILSPADASNGSPLLLPPLPTTGDLLDYPAPFVPPPGASFWRGARVLVIGAPSALGGALLREVAGLHVDALLALSTDEAGLQQVAEEIASLIPLLGTPTDEARLAQILAQHAPTVIFHLDLSQSERVAAANQREALRHSVGSTHLLLTLGAQYGVRQLIVRSHPPSEGISLMDRHPADPRAIRAVLGRQVAHQCNRYMNNRLEQDHRAIKQRDYPMRGFGAVASASHYGAAFDELRDSFRPCHRMNATPSLAQQRQRYRQRFAALMTSLLAV